MGTGYTRNDSSNNIADGNVINASDFDGEFNAIESAMGTSGHTHDGTAAEGGPVLVVGPAQDLVVSTSEVKPKTDNALDLGTASLQFKNAYFQGTIDTDGIMTAATFEPDGDTAAGDNAAIGYTAALGIIVTGQGSTNDITLVNDADATVLSVPTGTTNVDIVGVATAATFEPDGDTAAGDDAAIGYTAAEGLILTGQGSTSDITLKNDADAVVFTVPTGTDDILFPDGAKAMFGGGSDLQIYHDGSNSYVNDIGTGDLVLKTAGAGVQMWGGGDVMLNAVKDGAVTLYHDNAAKLATASGGVTVTGEMAATTMDLSSNAVIDGTALVTGVLTTTAQVVQNGGFDSNDASSVIAADGAADNEYALRVENLESTDDRSYGLYIQAGSTATDDALQITEHTGGTTLLNVSGNGAVTIPSTALVTGVLTTTAAAVFNGGFTSNADTNTFTSANSTDPRVVIKNTTNDTNAAVLNFVKDKGAAGADDDSIGSIFFTGDNDAQEQTLFARINGVVETAADGQEGGKIQLRVATHDGEMQTGLEIFDGSAEDEIDVNIANGTSSVTTVAGTLTATKLVSANGVLELDDNGSHNGIINSPASLRINIDSDAGSTGESFQVGHNQTSIDSNNILFKVADDGSLSTPTLGASNVRFGVNAGNSILLNGNYNTVVGDEAGTAITISSYSTGLGYKALFSNVLGSKSTAVGGFALYSQNPAGSTAVEMFNTAVGYDAGNGLTTGTKNTFIGALSGDAIVTGSENVAVGYVALTDLTSGTGNVAVGEECGSNITTGSNNVAVGKLALFTNISGGQNIAIGPQALRVSTGSNNLAIGSSALKANVGGLTNVAIGHEAMLTNVDGDGNTAVGHEALKTMEPADGLSHNTAVGFSAGKLVSTGTGNTFVGAEAGDGTQTGGLNTAVGYKALSAVSGSGNTAIGVGALNASTNNRNTALGYHAGLVMTGGDNNTVLGYESGLAILGGHNNTFVGRSAGLAVNSGNYNTLVGVQAGDNITSGDSNIIIGQGLDAASATADSQLNIGGWIVGSAGQITMPSQPAFQVANSSTQSNIATGSQVTVALADERFDVGANFTGNTFTAPVTGRYQLQVFARIDNIDSAAAYYELKIATSNRGYGVIFDPDFGQDAVYWHMSFSILADMDADDTSTIEIRQEGGTSQTDIVDVKFSGYLAC